MYSVSDIMTISCGDDRELSREFSPVLTLISWFLDSVMVENVFSKEGLKPGMKETLADTCERTSNNILYKLSWGREVA